MRSISFMYACTRCRQPTLEGCKTAMRRVAGFPGLVLALTLAVLPLFPLAADGGYFGPPRTVAVSTDQRAILIRGNEKISITFSTGYTGDGKNFAWVIPVPAVPELEDIRETGEIAETAFRLLEQQTAPFYTPAPMGWRGAGGKAEGPLSCVTVHGTVLLEHYQASVLGAASGSSLLDWLTQNGYEVSRAAESVLDAYVQDNWAFVAVKLNPGELRRYEDEFLPPLTIACPGDEMVFPVRISSVSTVGIVRITLFVISTSTVSSFNMQSRKIVYTDRIPSWEDPDRYVADCIAATVERADGGLAILWKGRIEWSGELFAALQDLGGPDFSLPSRSYLTRLETRLAPEDMTADIQLDDDLHAGGFAVELTGAHLAEPRPVAGVSDARDIVSMRHEAAILKRDGTVWRWTWPPDRGGARSVLRRIPNLTGIVSLAAGQDHILALKDDGTVWAWSYLNRRGYLGIGSTEPSPDPVRVEGLGDIAAISAGYESSAAVRRDGTVWTWGGNYSGILGDRTTEIRYSPVQVPGLRGVKAIAVGAFHMMALKEDGTLWGWGGNSDGELGNGGSGASSRPVQVRGLSGVIQVSAGLAHTVALKNDGSVWVWGRRHGRVPQKIESLQDIVMVCAQDQDFAMALEANGTVWAWGSNKYGQLGIEGSEENRDPDRVPGLERIKSIAATEIYKRAAVTDDGALYAWGYW